MFTYPNKNRWPSGGKFFYVVPETQTFIESYQSWDDLFSQVRRHYAVNKREIPADLLARIEDYMCRQLPAGSCVGTDGGRPVTARNPQFFDVVNTLENFFRGRRRELISVEEAQVRAGVCHRCPQNWLGFCTSCNGLKALARRLVHGMVVPLETQMGVCRLWRMPLNAVIFVKDPPSGKLEFPANCWVRKGECLSDGHT